MIGSPGFFHVCVVNYLVRSGNPHIQARNNKKAGKSSYFFFKGLPPCLQTEFSRTIRVPIPKVTLWSQWIIPFWTCRRNRRIRKSFLIFWGCLIIVIIYFQWIHMLNNKTFIVKKSQKMHYLFSCHSIEPMILINVNVNIYDLPRHFKATSRMSSSEIGISYQ